MTIDKRDSERRHLLLRARVAILVMSLKSLLRVAVVILVLELKVVLHHRAHVLRTRTVQGTMVLFKLELKWDGDLGPFW